MEQSSAEEASAPSFLSSGWNTYTLRRTGSETGIDNVPYEINFFEDMLQSVIWPHSYDPIDPSSPPTRVSGKRGRLPLVPSAQLRFPSFPPRLKNDFEAGSADFGILYISSADSHPRQSDGNYLFLLDSFSQPKSTRPIL